MKFVGVGVLDDPPLVYLYTWFGLSRTPAPTKKDLDKFKFVTQRKSGGSKSQTTRFYTNMNL